MMVACVMAAYIMVAVMDTAGLPAHLSLCDMNQLCRYVRCIAKLLQSTDCARFVHVEFIFPCPLHTCPLLDYSYVPYAPTLHLRMATRNPRCMHAHMASTLHLRMATRNPRCMHSHVTSTLHLLIIASNRRCMHAHVTSSLHLLIIASNRRCMHAHVADATF